MSQILWVVPKWTLPAIDGARVATEKLISNYISLGHEVDVLVLAQPHEVCDEAEMLNKWKCRSVTVLRRPLPNTKFSKILYYAKRFITSPLVPLTFSSFDEKCLFFNIKSFLNDKHYDFTVYDGLHLAMAFKRFDQSFKKMRLGRIILRSHNMEQDLWRDAASKANNPFIRFFMQYQKCLVSRFELKVLTSVDGVASISEDDLSQIKSLCQTPSWLTPLGMKFSDALDSEVSEGTNLLFIGRLDWAPNKDGLKDFLDYVWPKVIENRSDLYLTIVGSGDGSWLDSYADLKNVIIHGFVDSIDDCYKACDFTIVPLNFGSGTRIKVIESIAKGRALISTDLGIQGSGLDRSMYYPCNSTVEWINTLSHITLDNEARMKFNEAQAKLNSTFDEVNVAKHFDKMLNSLL